MRFVQESMAFIAAYEGEIPGASRIECGNYLLHDLAGAKQLAASMIPVLEGWKEENLIYENNACIFGKTCGKIILRLLEICKHIRGKR